MDTLTHSAGWCRLLRRVGTVLLLPILAASQSRESLHTVRIDGAMLNQLAVPAPAAVLSDLGVRRGDVPVTIRFARVEYDTLRAVLFVEGCVTHAEGGTALAGMRIVAARYDSLFSPAVSPTAASFSDEEGNFHMQWHASSRDVLCLTLLGHLESYIPIGHALSSQLPASLLPR